MKSIPRSEAETRLFFTAAHRGIGEVIMMNCGLLNAARARDIQRLITSHVVWYGSALRLTLAEETRARLLARFIIAAESTRRRGDDGAPHARDLRGSNLAIKK